MDHCDQTSRGGSASRRKCPGERPSLSVVFETGGLMGLGSHSGTGLRGAGYQGWARVESRVIPGAKTSPVIGFRPGQPLTGQPRRGILLPGRS